MIINPYWFLTSTLDFAKWVPSEGTAWTDAFLGTQAGIGDQVAVLQDSSGNGRHLNFNAGARPTLQQEGTGEYYLNFTGSQGGASFLIWGGAQQATIVSSFLRTSAATDQLYYELSANYNNNDGVFIGFGAAGDTARFTSHVNTPSSSYAGYETSQDGTTAAVHTHVIDFTGTTLDTEAVRVRSNGASDKATAITSGDLTGSPSLLDVNLYVGARNRTSLQLTGKMYFLGISASALSLTDVQTAEAEASLNTPGISL